MEVAQESITLDELGRRVDILGQQMNWLCENLQSLFGFVNAMSANGGGVRGLMKALKEQPTTTMVAEEEEDE
jgi:hypothetical protein